LTKSKAPEIKYEKPDGKLTFDLLENLARRYFFLIKI
jgi:hypothetical protein